MPAAANPTTPSLWAGRIFTTLVFILAFAALLDGVIGAPGDWAGRLLIAAGVIYSVGALILWMRGDYILRLFGCAWPFFLPKVDEMQQAQRQRAFAATYSVFTGVFSFFVGLQIGAALMQTQRGDEITGFLSTDPVIQLLSLVFVLLALTLTPQAYLAWTLKPLDEEIDGEDLA